MKKVWVASGLAAVLVVWWLVSLSFDHRAEAESRGSATPAILYYRDPMHPSYTSDKPGKAPDCGMDLVPVYAGPHRAQNALLPALPGVVRISPERQQLIGVRLGRVETSSTVQTLRALGRVAPDETRVFPLTTGAECWVTEIYSGGTGSAVQKGQPLVAVYGRDYTTAQRTFLYALRAVENGPQVLAGDDQDQSALNLKEARLNMENLGIGEAQIQQITRTRQVALSVTLAAPAAGVIVARNVYPRQRVDRGVELFRIADLSHVWIVADLFGEDARYVQSGLTARVSLAGRPATTIRATVSHAFSNFDAASRSLQVRLEAANPDLILRPGMFVDLEFPVTLPPAATVPADALLESGLRKIVFVDRGGGVFEPRPVETGWRFGDRVQIVRGLSPGESIVVSGNFLLDSESRMQRDARPHD